MPLRRYWDLYPNETLDVAPNIYKPIDAPNIAMQAVMRAWSTPRNGRGRLSCTYTDLCGEIFPGAPYADGRPGITDEYPFDNSTFPEWKAKELRQACVRPPRMPAPTPTPHTLSRTPHATSQSPGHCPAHLHRPPRSLTSSVYRCLPGVTADPKCIGIARRSLSPTPTSVGW